VEAAKASSTPELTPNAYQLVHPQKKITTHARESHPPTGRDKTYSRNINLIPLSLSLSLSLSLALAHDIPN
jgi:hypothetical protein